MIETLTCFSFDPLSILMLCIMQFFLLYLAIISTAITSPVVDLGLLDPSSLVSSADQGSGVDVPETERTSVSPANSGLDSFDTTLLSLANSDSVIGTQPPNTDVHALDSGSETLHQGELAMLPFVWIPQCETLFRGTKAYCCDEEIDKKEHTAKGCDHCTSLSRFLYT